MKKKQREEFQELLMEERERLIEQLKAMGYELENGEGDVLDSADVASDYSERELRRGISNHEFRILRRIDAALNRIEEGTYGKCAVDGKPIEDARLEAIPYVCTCIAHKEEEERIQSELGR